MIEEAYRVLWRRDESDWHPHTGGSSSSNGLYTKSGAKSVLTRLRRDQERYGWHRGYEYKLQKSPLVWEDVDA